MSTETRPLFQKSLQELQIAFWLRRAAHWFVRAAWMALLVPTIFMAGYLWLGWEVRWYYWVLPMLLIAALSILLSIRPIRLKKIVRRLDDRLGLQARLSTAFEISGSDEAHNPVTQELLEETEDIAHTLRRGVSVVNRTLWVEMQALIAVAAVLAALLMVDALSPRVPNVQPIEDLTSTWQEPTAGDVMPEQPLAESIAAEDNVQTDDMKEDFDTALKILADELRDEAASHAIAEAIDDKDLKRAATELRRLADQLDNISAEARAELGGSLQGAANKIGDIAPSITGPVQAGSTALANNDLVQAGTALEDLAEVIEGIEDDPAEVAEYKPIEEETINEPSPVEPEQQQLNPEQESTEDPLNEMESKEETTEDERLSMEGDPLELESETETEDRVTQTADPGAEADQEQTEGTPFTRQPLITTSRQLGADPLVYPWEKRDVIRRYFTPE